MLRCASTKAEAGLEVATRLSAEDDLLVRREFPPLKVERTGGADALAERFSRRIEDYVEQQLEAALTGSLRSNPTKLALGSLSLATGGLIVLVLAAAVIVAIVLLVKLVFSAFATDRLSPRKTPRGARRRRKSSPLPSGRGMAEFTSTRRATNSSTCGEGRSKLCASSKRPEPRPRLLRPAQASCQTRPSSVDSRFSGEAVEAIDWPIRGGARVRRAPGRTRRRSPPRCRP